jgi:hypothetical protein
MGRIGKKGHFHTSASDVQSTSSMPSESLRPDDIRRLRGQRSRAAFARDVGVTALTIYRWELPDGAPEARRPRGTVLARLLGTTAAPATPVTPLPAVAEVAGELERVGEGLEALATGDWRRAEDALVRALTGGLRGAAVRTRAITALARLRLLRCGEVQAAFATLVPLLGECAAGALPRAAEAEVHATAALVFAQMDGRLFDAGRVNFHAARAEALFDADTSIELRVCVRAAQVEAAANLGDSALVSSQYALVEPLLDERVPPLLVPLLIELSSIRALRSGQAATLARHREAAEVARSLDLPLWEARNLAFAAVRELDDARSPLEVVARAARSLEVARAGRVAPGLHTLLAARAEAEALLRLARFDEAERVIAEGYAVAEQVAWSPVWIATVDARFLWLTGRVEALAARGVALEAWDGVAQRAATRCAGGLFQAWAQFLVGGDIDATANNVDALLERLRAAGGWLALESDGRLMSFAIRAFGGPVDRAQGAMSRLARFLDRYPQPWVQALAMRLEAILLLRQGRMMQAAQLVDSALASFELVGDVTETLLTRRIRAVVGVREPGGAERLRAVLDDLAGHGIVIPKSMSQFQAQATTFQPVPRGERGAALSVPIQRLTLRGLAPELICQELAAILAERFPGRALRLVQRDSDAVLAAAGPDLPVAEVCELGDGMGGRMHVVMSGDFTEEELTDIRTVALVAALALEVAVLRGLAVPRTPAEDVVEDGFLAAAPSMRRLRDEIARLSGSRATVIVTGESGVGKEIVARAIHDRSTRTGRAFVAFNCAAVPRDLFEGQLFGHKKGAFTGATADSPGVIGAADGGTLFLDEIGELPLDLQPKLLRFLENGEVFPLGERRPIQVDVRVIAATHRDLAELVRAGRFREDLYFRLQVVPISIPPLRERPEDVPVLARHFLRTLAPEGAQRLVFSPDALAALAAQPWPGNVRELRNVIERALAYQPLPPVITAHHLRLR